MGNSQSCPDSPVCRALCWTKPPTKDDGEWFGNLPRDKKLKKKSRSRKSLTKMPVVPEGTESVCSDTGEDESKNDESGVENSGSGTRSTVSETSSLGSSASETKAERKDQKTRKSIEESKAMRQPKAKLTFVNGQFVDGSTREGQEVLEASLSGERSGSIGGIVTSIESGHGTTARSLSSSSSSSSDKAKPILALPNIPRRLSRVRSIASSTSKDLEDSGLSGTADTKISVSSIVELGSGYFLTSSSGDNVIKMWKLDDANGRADVHFVRDFVGHSVGITCLAKVDGKGRFLSASKEMRVKLWDSRYSFNDTDDEPNADRILLATFENIGKRGIRDIAVIEDGSYVRPTDNIDMAMTAAMTKKALKEGSAAVQRAAHERQIISCTCKFATISGRHKEVSVWSVKQIDQDGQLPLEGNVAEVKLKQELKHDAVVTSIASLCGKGKILTGDRMGKVVLWSSAKNVLHLGSTSLWSSVRTFNWRSSARIASVDENMEAAITSLSFLQGNRMFVSGSKGGSLRVWDSDGSKKSGDGSKKSGDVIKKEIICITGAHSLAITTIEQGPRVDDDGNSLSFSSASEDGKVLSFAVPASRVGKCNPFCFNVVNHGIANRYSAEADPIAVTGLMCLNLPDKNDDMLITGSMGGDVNVLKSRSALQQGAQNDALLLYRSSMEQESLTLHTIAKEVSSTGGVECRNRTLNLFTYKDCFLGSDLITYLVDSGYAASRKDALNLGLVLARYLSLFECVTKAGKDLQDSAKSYYRFLGEFSLNSGD